VHIFMCIHVCMYIYAYMHIHIHIFLYVCTFVHVCMHIHLYLCSPPFVSVGFLTLSLFFAFLGFSFFWNRFEDEVGWFPAKFCVEIMRQEET